MIQAAADHPLKAQPKAPSREDPRVYPKLRPEAERGLDRVIAEAEQQELDNGDQQQPEAASSGKRSWQPQFRVPETSRLILTQKQTGKKRHHKPPAAHQRHFARQRKLEGLRARRQNQRVKQKRRTEKGGLVIEEESATSSEGKTQKKNLRPGSANKKLLTPSQWCIRAKIFIHMMSLVPLGLRRNEELKTTFLTEKGKGMKRVKKSEQW